MTFDKSQSKSKFHSSQKKISKLDQIQNQIKKTKTTANQTQILIKTMMKIINPICDYLMKNLDNLEVKREINIENQPLNNYIFY